MYVSSSALSLLYTYTFDMFVSISLSPFLLICLSQARKVSGHGVLEVSMFPLLRHFYWSFVVFLFCSLFCQYLPACFFRIEFVSSQHLKCLLHRLLVRNSIPNSNNKIRTTIIPIQIGSSIRVRLG